MSQKTAQTFFLSNANRPERKLNAPMQNISAHSSVHHDGHTNPGVTGTNTIRTPPFSAIIGVCMAQATIQV